MRNYTNNDLFSRMDIFEELNTDFLEEIPKTLEMSKFYPYEVNIMYYILRKESLNCIAFPVDWYGVLVTLHFLRHWFEYARQDKRSFIRNKSIFDH